MNTIRYIHPQTLEQKTVKVGQGGVSWMDQDGQRKLVMIQGVQTPVLPANHSKRRLTMAEADAEMYRRGFVRLKKFRPGEKMKKAA